MNSRNYKDSYHGKKDLNILAIIILVVSLAILAVGVVLIVTGALHDGVVGTVLCLIFGCLLAVAGLVGAVIALILLITSNSMKVDKGSVKEGNVSKIGTVNANLCPKCGTELAEDGSCPNCSRD